MCPWSHTRVVALVQSPPAIGSDPVGGLADDIAVLCSEHPDVSMVAYPELHLFGGSDLAPDANDWLAGVAEPLDGPRVAALAEIAAAVLNVVKTVGPDRALELVLARVNAIVNQVYFLSLNAAGPVGAGRSIYVDPNGDVIAERPDAEAATTFVEIDPARVRHVREHGTAGLNRLWHHFRPDDAPIHQPASDGYMSPRLWTPAPPADLDPV